jgi:predicted metal-dependent hydrolase
VTVSAVPELPLTFTTVLRGRPVTYRLVISRRARAWRVSIHPHTGLSVVVPAGARMDVAALLESHAAWIHRHLDRLARDPLPTRTPLAHGSLLPYRGALLQLEVTPNRFEAPRYDPGIRTLRVNGGSGRQLLTEVEAWYRRQAEEVFRERLHMVNAELGYRFGRVSIRDQRTRWGSCSPTGNLSFNWRLLMAPSSVLDSVVAHELTHLADRTHARSFWRRLAAVDPDYDAHRRWLTRYGAWLVLESAPTPPVHPSKHAGRLPHEETPQSVLDVGGAVPSTRIGLNTTG